MSGVEVDGAVDVVAVADEQDVLELRQRCRGSVATLRRYSAGVVTSTLPSPRSSRWWIGSGPKAENSGQKTLRVLERAERGDVQLRDPAEQGEHPVAPPTPRRRSTLAKRLVRSRARRRWRR